MTKILNGLRAIFSMIGFLNLTSGLAQAQIIAPPVAQDHPSNLTFSLDARVTPSFVNIVLRGTDSNIQRSETVLFQSGAPITDQEWNERRASASALRSAAPSFCRLTHNTGSAVGGRSIFDTRALPLVVSVVREQRPYTDFDRSSPYMTTIFTRNFRLDYTLENGSHVIFTCVSPNHVTGDMFFNDDEILNIVGPSSIRFFNLPRAP